MDRIVELKTRPRPTGGEGARDPGGFDRIIVDLQSSGRLAEGRIESAFRAITEACAQGLGAAEVSIREFTQGRARLECRARYAAAEAADGGDAPWREAECPELFGDLRGPRVLVLPRGMAETGGARAGRHCPSVHAPIWAAGRPYGVLTITAGTQRRNWDPVELRFAGSMADLTAIAIESCRRQLAQIALADSEDKFQVIAEATGSAIFLFDDRIRYLNPALVAISGYPREELLGMPIRELFDPRSEIHLKDFFAARDRGATQPIGREIEIRTKSGERRWLYASVGVMLHQGQATCLATAFDITDRKRFEADLHTRAFHDALTGLPNRALFMERLEHAIVSAKRRPEFGFAVVFLDLDRFKVINDSLGHAIGDRLLIEIGQRLARVLREQDTIARLGGDEFTVLLEDVREPGYVEAVARRIGRCVAATVMLDEHEVCTTASMGIVIDDHSYQNAGQVLRDADIALYQAKAKGKDCFAMFDERMRVGSRKLLTLFTDLRHAISREEFRLLLQPIVELERGTVTGFEALIRWQRGTGEQISPAEFIPVAEDTGLIVRIGDWVIAEACALIQRWRLSHPEHPVSIAVNVSGKQLMHPGFLQSLRDHLQTHAVDPRLLKIELTESVLIDNSELVLERMLQLKALGLELALDDFGTGYSSLSYLHRFPLDTLKIDRSFVSRLGEQCDKLGIVGTIVALARNLNMKVVAEGIETAAQLRQLIGMQCDYGQGYFFSRPVDTAAAELLLRRRQLADLSQLRVDPAPDQAVAPIGR